MMGKEKYDAYFDGFYFDEHGERKSIPYEKFLEVGHKIKRGFAPRLDYLSIVDEIYCKS